MAVAIVFAIGLVVLVVIGDEIVEREAVMGGGKAEARPGLAAALIEDVARGRDPGGQFAEFALVTLPVGSDGVTEAVVPLRPARREASDLISPWPDIPGLRDQLDGREDGVLAAAVEKSAALVRSHR